jgi:hypothetical protein
VLNPRLLVLVLIGSTAGFAQQRENPKFLESPITLSVGFTRSISADHSKAGDTVEATTNPTRSYTGGWPNHIWKPSDRSCNGGEWIRL